MIDTTRPRPAALIGALAIVLATTTGCGAIDRERSGISGGEPVLVTSPEDSETADRSDPIETPRSDPAPSMSEEELAELEAELDDLERLLGDVEADLADD